MRTYVYIDWFNLYKGMIENSSYQWINLAGMIRSMLDSNYDVVKIKMFTARLLKINQREIEPKNQEIFHKALETYIPEIEIHKGYFSSREVLAPLADTKFNNKVVKIRKIEEKKTDVSLAVHLINDFWLKNYDCAILISNDSDFGEALKLLSAHNEIKIGLFTPNRKVGNIIVSEELRKFADFHRRIPNWALKWNQLPKRIPGTNIVKPPNW